MAFFLGGCLFCFFLPNARYIGYIALVLDEVFEASRNGGLIMSDQKNCLRMRLVDFRANENVRLFSVFCSHAQGL